jgi:hemoglobin-like flavoprotein
MITVTPLQRNLVQRSFRKIAGRADQVADLLYERLFEIDPDYKMLFACDMRQQGRKLIQMLAVVVNGLNHPNTLIPTIRELGQRHVGYGVKPQDYQHLGTALIYAVEQTLEDDFTPEVRDAWIAVYRFVLDIATASPAEN